MQACRHLLASIAFAAALGAAPPTYAAAYLYQPAGAGGSYYSDEGLVLNTNYGFGFQASDGSTFHYVICVGSDPDLPDCSIPPGPPPPPNAWYELPNSPTSAAAQAWNPDYGISRVRSWSSGTHGIDSGAPGYTRYGASANAGWHDEITTSSLTPVVITFVVALHVDWNDGGVFGLHMGRPGEYDPDVGPAISMDGWTWTNCAVCQFLYDTGPARTVYPGGANGSTDVIVSVGYTVYPAFSDNPFDPTTNPFESFLGAYSSDNDAEVLAYSSANLLAILVPPGADLTFASGHAYNIQVVPEPATYALWALGLVAVGWVKRRRVAER